MRSVAVALTVCLAMVGSGGCGERRHPGRLRVGHFPNLTHAQALVMRARSRVDAGWIEGKVGMPVDWYGHFTAGPEAMEALRVGSLDLAYVGPNPALNAHLKTNGNEVRVVAGSALGGAALVVQGDSGVEDARGLRGKRIATPMFGNTQDVAARSWLRQHGIHVTQSGGDAQIRPTDNPDQLALFRKKELDAVWTVEPWVTRLIQEAGGRVLVDETDALTTVLVARRAFLEQHRDVVKRFVEAHREVTAWIHAHEAEARAAVGAEVLGLTRTALPPGVLDQAWKRLRFTAEITRDPFDVFVKRAQAVGFLEDAGTLERLVEVP
jgi:NitT/TauT family transport system substrate-binding protein